MGVIVYKCINCGGPLAFKAETQDWTCDYCLSQFTEEEVQQFIKKEEQSQEFSAEEQVREHEFQEKSVGYSCTSCGAEIVTDDTTAATFCYYCHNPTIIPRRLEGEFRPEKVIPFKLSKEKAAELFIAWCRKKPLLPRVFGSQSQLEKLTGIYVPFWLFDCDVSGNVQGKATKVRSYVRGDTRITETRHYRVGREGKAIFQGVPADGSKKMDDDLMAILEPFDYQDLEDFSMSYLSGYYAEKYDMDHNEVYPRVTQLLRTHMQTLLTNTIQGYSTVSIQHSNVKFHNVKVSYCLLPVWMFTYQFQGKTYVFAMNGQTGKIAGELPISKARAFAWFGGVAAGVFAILSAGGLFLW